jgi:hypothetical protein
MAVPEAFTPEAVAAKSGDDACPYRAFMKSREPFASLFGNNPALVPPKPGDELEWGAGHYYDTTVGGKHPYWKDQALPGPTQDLDQLRQDLYGWGYCLIEAGMSPEQCVHMRCRLEEQAEGERIAGIAHMTPSFQIVWTLVNKGECFAKCVDHDPEAVQAAAVIEQLVNESLGRGWYSYSFVSNAAFPGGHPQALHQDQSAISPWQTPEAPVLMNTMYVMQDVDEVNGGTLIIPGSHRLMSEVGSGKPVGELPPAINLEAPAGTIVMFDGRMLHGTGANRSDQWRYVMTQANVKPWLRQQENWVLAVRPEVMAKASPKLLQRMGFQATAGYGLTEGHGMLGSGKAGDPHGDLTTIRRDLDEGCYARVGELTPETARALAPDALTLQRVQAAYPKRRGNKGTQ